MGTGNNQVHTGNYMVLNPNGYDEVSVHAKREEENKSKLSKIAKSNCATMDTRKKSALSSIYTGSKKSPRNSSLMAGPTKVSPIKRDR